MAKYRISSMAWSCSFLGASQMCIRDTGSGKMAGGLNKGGADLKEMQEDGRFCRAYLRTMDAERAAAEIGRKDGYAMLALSLIHI